LAGSEETGKRTTMIYLDNAASTQTAKEVIEAMRPYQDTFYGNPSSLHQLGQKSSEAIESARATISNKLNAKPHEIIFTSGGTEANNLALQGAITKTKNHIITTVAEHKSILNVCKSLEARGITVSYIPVDEEGYVNMEKLKQEIKNNTAIVSVIHANNEIGTINDITAIGEICKEKNVFFHVDACQSFLKEPIDVKAMNISLLNINAHKIHGPKGIGALYVKENIKLQPLLFGGEQERGLRSGTENVPAIVGFAKAVEIYKEQDNNHMQTLQTKLINGLLQIENTRLNGPKERLCNNINISFQDVEAEQLVKHLDTENILVSAGSACTSNQIEPSHVLKAIGLDDQTANSSIRFSLSRYNTEEEISTVIEKTKQVVESLHTISNRNL
jgi:cysteine desulfurase